MNKILEVIPGIIITWSFIISFLYCLYLVVKREKKTTKEAYTPRAKKDLEEYLKKAGE